MTEVISVKFKDGGKAYYFDPAGNRVKEGAKVIVETQSGKELGTVSEGHRKTALQNVKICK